MLDMTAGGTPTDEPPLINLILEPPPGALQSLDRGYAYFRGLWSFEFPSKPNLLEGSKPLEGPAASLGLSTLLSLLTLLGLSTSLGRSDEWVRVMGAAKAGTQGSG